LRRSTPRAFGVAVSQFDAGFDRIEQTGRQRHETLGSEAFGHATDVRIDPKISWITTTAPREGPEGSARRARPVREACSGRSSGSLGQSGMAEIT
jgi:hypothetical protein